MLSSAVRGAPSSASLPAGPLPAYLGRLVSSGPARWAGLLGLCLILAAPPAEARVWRVEADGGGDLPTIAAAIAAAASQDTLDLSAGVHAQTERLIIENKTLTLRGAGIDQTIIEGAPHGNILYLHGPNNSTEIRDLTFRRGVADQPGDPLFIGTEGGGIHSEAADFTLTRVRLTDCHAGAGGGLGGGIYMTSIDRRAGVVPGGRLRPLANGFILLDQVTIDHCESGSEGGGLYAEGAIFVLRQCRFENNESVEGGGVRILDSVGNIENCLFRNNFAEFFGGGIKVQQNLGDFIHIEGNTFVANRANRGGAGVELFRTINVTLKRNIFVDQGGRAGDAYGCDPPGSFDTECNLSFNNPSSDRVNCPEEPTLLQVDPRFCSAAAGDYRLCADSPALAGPCGPRGAFGIGCSGPGCSTAAHPITWSEIKALHGP